MKMDLAVYTAQEGYSWHGEAESVDNLKFLVTSAVSKSGIVMVAQREADVSLAHGLLILVHVTV